MFARIWKLFFHIYFFAFGHSSFQVDDLELKIFSEGQIAKDFYDSQNHCGHDITSRDKWDFYVTTDGNKE